MDISLPDSFLTDVLRVLLRVGVAILIVLAGRWLARRSRIWLAQVMARATLTPSMESLFLSVAYYSVWIVTIMAALIVLGVPAAAVLTVVGVALLLLGVALQQSLRDLAAAVNFVLFKPFVVGDLIETKGITGTVEEIQLFNTMLVRWDNKVIILPNGEIQQAGITNFTKKQVLRTDLNIRISYDAHVDHARRLIEALLAADPRVLPEPPAAVLVTDLRETGVNLSVRAAVASADYWSLQNDLRERIKARFDEEGITIPSLQGAMTAIQQV
jgi:small conductance mechanosensitive channel